MWLDNFDLNKTAIITRKTITNDGMGGVMETTSTIATVPCAVWQQGASEQIANDRIKNPSTHTIVIKPLSTIRADDTITIGTDVFRIVRPDNVLGYDDIMVIGAELNG